VKSNKQSARSNGRLAKGKVIAGDLTTMPGDKYFMKSHKQIKDESQTQKKRRKITFQGGGKSENRGRRSNMTTQPRQDLNISPRASLPKYLHS